MSSRCTIAGRVVGALAILVGALVVLSAAPTAGAATGQALQEYVNDGAAGRLWNAYNQSQDAMGPDISSRPSAITYGPTVQMFVRSASGDLMSWVNDNFGGHLWNAYDLSTLAGAGAPIVGTPDAIANGPAVDVFAESAAGDLVEYANDGVGGRLWNAYDLSALAASGGAVQGDPNAVFVGSAPVVFVRGASDELFEYADSGGGWTATDLSAASSGGAPFNGDPSALDVAGTLQVFTNTAGSLTEYTNVAGQWRANIISNAANGEDEVNGDPAAVLYGSTVHVYIASSNGDLTEYDNDGANGRTWNAYDLSADAGGGGTVQGDPATLLYGPTVHVYVQSSGGDLVEYVNDGAAGRLWNAYDLSVDAGAGGPISTDPAAVLYGGRVVHVYAGGSNSCPTNLAGQLANTGGASQLITVDSPSYSSTSATLTAWQLEGGCWQPVLGPFSARVGTTGISDHKSEGDGATPTGAFSIGATMYGVNANPGVSYAYHQLVCGDWWDEDPSSADYNTFEHVPCGTSPPFGGDSEALWQTLPAYEYFAVIDYNTGPVVPGAGVGDLPARRHRQRHRRVRQHPGVGPDNGARLAEPVDEPAHRDRD